MIRNIITVIIKSFAHEMQDVCIFYIHDLYWNVNKKLNHTMKIKPIVFCFHKYMISVKRLDNHLSIFGQMINNMIIQM